MWVARAGQLLKATKGKKGGKKYEIRHPKEETIRHGLHLAKGETPGILEAVGPYGAGNASLEPMAYGPWEQEKWAHRAFGTESESRMGGLSSAISINYRGQGESVKGNKLHLGNVRKGGVGNIFG